MPSFDLTWAEQARGQVNSLPVAAKRAVMAILVLAQPHLQVRFRLLGGGRVQLWSCPVAVSVVMVVDLSWPRAPFSAS